MAGVPFKFRCYRCNQLLGVSRSKIGATVSCPKCAAELLVPEPSESPSASEMPAASTSLPGVEAPFDFGLPLDLIDIRPEDIRVEPGVAVEVAPHEPTPSPFAGATPREDESYGIEPSSLVRTADVPSYSPAEPAPTVVAVAPQTNAEPVVPPIRLESQKLLTERPVVRSRDVTLPRSAVAAWSLFVLLAQGLAFVAGLLAGHFIWKVH